MILFKGVYTFDIIIIYYLSWVAWSVIIMELCNKSFLPSLSLSLYPITQALMNILRIVLSLMESW